MRSTLHCLKNTLVKRTEFTICLLIFLTCLFVYLANNRTTLGSSDNIPHTLLAFNWLQNQTLQLDAFRNGYLFRGDEHPYFFSEDLNGHLTSRYPIGTSLIAFPLHLLFFAGLKLSSFFQAVTTGASLNLDITSESFSTYRNLFSKLAGTIITAFSVVIFYLSVRLKFNHGVSLIATFIFAFATSSWALNSQDLRQHTVSNLLLISVILCLMKADRTTGYNRWRLLCLAGIFSGLFPAVRITSAVFTIAALVYVVFAFRREAIFFLLGVSSLSLHFAWNFYHFGAGNMLVGGYVEQLNLEASDTSFSTEHVAASYTFSPQYFIQAFLGLLISPSEGFFTYSPVLLFAIPGISQLFKLKSGRDEQLLLCLLLACIVLLLQYCFYDEWAGGSGSYGCRFLTDTLPVVCVPVAYFIAHLTTKLKQSKYFFPKAAFLVFLVSLLISVFIQTVGVFTDTDWGVSPVPLLSDRSRIWSLTDSQIVRHSRNLFAQLTEPIQEPEQYSQSLNGTVEKIEVITRTDKIVDATHEFRIFSNQRRVLMVSLRNTGQSQWYGYQTGLVELGETKLRVRFIDENGKEYRPRQKNWLNVSGTPKPGERTQAIGRVKFPKKLGEYRMVFDIIASGFEDAVDLSKPPIHTVNVTVIRKNSKD